MDAPLLRFENVGCSVQGLDQNRTGELFCVKKCFAKEIANSSPGPIESKRTAEIYSYPRRKRQVYSES